MGIIRTGKFLDADTAKRLQELGTQAQNTPLMLITQRERNHEVPPLAIRLQQEFHEKLNAAVVATGFAEPKRDEDGDVINYGCDFKTGEILEWDGAA